MSFPEVELKSADPGKTFSEEKAITVDGEKNNVEQGHLQELEVDIAQVVLENEEFDEDSDHSPYPEGEQYEHV
jgi:hypothetical protein